jgi:predicted Zn-dependent protease
LSQAYRETTYSFRNVSASEAAGWKPWRVRLHQVRAGDTVESLAARLPFDKLKVERFRAINGLGAGEALRPGQTVKLVAAGN